MNVAVAAKPLDQLVEQYGPMRTVLNSAGPADVPREQADAFGFNLLGGKDLRMSVINGPDGRAVLSIRCVRYIDPVTQTERFAVDYWSVRRYWASDHRTAAMAELSYESAVRGEFARPTLPLSLERFTRGLASFYDRTDVTR
ncbi:hypothetical protein ACIBCC_29820 [Streptomyces griseus]|uniref:hypothetical protein n=1 Tax=Streptomyces griseus TaxID=1911 RepID=UPI0037B6A84E